MPWQRNASRGHHIASSPRPCNVSKRNIVWIFRVGAKRKRLKVTTKELREYATGENESHSSFLDVREKTRGVEVKISRSVTVLTLNLLSADWQGSVDKDSEPH